MTRLGGRILSTGEAGQESDDGFDLGPSWFRPETQPAIAALVDKPGLAIFAQHSDGDVMFERMSREKPPRYQGFGQEPQSMRLAGGTDVLIRAIASGLPPERVLRGMRVTNAALDHECAVLTIQQVFRYVEGHRRSEQKRLAGFGAALFCQWR